MDTTNGAKANLMRAVVWEGKPYSIAVRDVPRPSIQLPEDAIIRVTSAALCGSDLHVYHGLLGSSKPPWVIGHEAVGVVEEVGAATEQFKVGDRVLIFGAHSVGHFEVQNNLRRNITIYGLGPDFGNDNGCLAEYVRVPFADDSLVAIPDNSPDLDWLFLSDIFVTGWSGLDFARFESGDKVAIFGAGPVGLMCAYAAMLRGASKVYCIDYVQQRLEKAAKLGAIPINFTSDEGIASAQLLKLEPGGVKRVVDCVGQVCVNHKLEPEQNYVVQEAIKIASTEGGIGLVGVYSALPKTEGTPNADMLSPELLVALPQLWSKNVSLQGGSIDNLFWKNLPKLFELVKEGRAKLDFVVTAKRSIEQAPLAYELFDKKLETKIVFHISESS